jgi:aspartyl protease family protein
MQGTVPAASGETSGRGMALSAGARQAAGMAAGWLVVAGAAAVSVVYFSEIKAVALSALGLSAPSVREAAAGDTRTRQRVRSRSGPSVEIKAGAHGHFQVRAEINGRPIDVLVDSGASIVALTYDDARSVGVYVRDSDYTQRVSTANGVARVAPVVLDRVSIGNVMVRNVPAAVSEPGSLGVTLLGMSFLSRLSRVDMRAGVLVLEE